MTTAMRGCVLAAALAAVLLGFADQRAARSEEGAKAAPISKVNVEVLAGTCTTCHGPDGRSGGVMPSLAGQPYRVLHAQLLAFKSGEAKDATVMPRLARGYDDQELEALARYFSSVGNGTREGEE